MMGSESPFSDDIVYRVKAFILLVWGEASLTENLNFINECLGEDMEKYLTKKFWDIHKKTYKKKPIYWQFASPKGAFKVITYMHRMNPYTVQIIHDQYLQKHISWLGKQIEALDGSFDKRDMKKVENYRSQKIECEAYQLLLKDASVKQIKFDLDDGVTENYKLFDGVVSKIWRQII